MPDSLFASLAVAFALGLRHGFDPDHLATIDALPRAPDTAWLVATWLGLAFTAGMMMTDGLNGLLGNPAGDWIEGREIWVGAGVVAWMLGAFALGMAMARSGTGRTSSPRGAR